MQRAKVAAIFLIVVFSLGTIGYMIIEGWTFVDALYMVVITLSTVGYREAHPMSQGGQAFTILLIIVGAGIGVYALGSVMRPIIEGEMRKVLGRRKLEKGIKNIKDHYVVCGYGRMGSYICRELKQKNKPYIVIEKWEQALPRLEREGHLYLLGDATEDDVLIEAGVERAKGLVAVVESDADNVYITLTARELNPDLFILARSVDDSSERKLRRAGANKVISPYHMGAIRMVQAILRPAVMDFIEIASQGDSKELQLEELSVNENSSLAGKSLKEAELGKNLGIIVVSVKSAAGKMAFKPSSDTVINGGDTLIALGEPKDMIRLEKLLQP
jgi:voltage-gated potassium channel